MPWKIIVSLLELLPKRVTLCNAILCSLHQQSELDPSWLSLERDGERKENIVGMVGGGERGDLFQCGRYKNLDRKSKPLQPTL